MENKLASYAHACFFACIWGQKGGEQGATPSNARPVIGSRRHPDTTWLAAVSSSQAGMGGSSLCSVARLQVYPMDVEIE